MGRKTKREKALEGELSFSQSLTDLSIKAIRQLDRFLRLRCAGDILNLHLDGSYAEVCGAMVAFEKLSDEHFDKFKDKTITCFILGDSSLYLSALVSFRTSWDVICVSEMISGVTCPQRF